jgi:hypothetical protein
VWRIRNYYLKTITADQQTFGLNIDKDVVRRVLEKHYHPHPDDNGPSWIVALDF